MRKPIKDKDFEELRKEEQKRLWLEKLQEIEAKALTLAYRRMFVNKICVSDATFLSK